MGLGGARSYPKDKINYVKRFNRNSCQALHHVWKVKQTKACGGVAKHG